MNTFKHDNLATDVYASEAMRSAAPVEKIPHKGTSPQVAYRMVKDETYAETRPELNLATFVATYMDEEATRLMNEAIAINYIDETEYPRVAVMCGRCINILANLWNTPEEREWKTGALGIGSSEACMLGGVAAWLRWRARRKAAGKPYDKPNLVMSAAYQVVWEKFCQLWQIELRTVPLTPDHLTLDPEAAVAMCDENTICVVPICGVTWTGLDDDVEALDKALTKYHKASGNDIPIHVDAASGGFILPFLHPEKKWDFRLDRVLSISTSGHKYGLVYPGLGWVIWKDKKYLPEEMSFSVNYLGASITQVGLNFSRPAAQILGQYYNFIRYGFEGYKAVQQASMEVAEYCHREIGKIPCFRNYAEKIDNPLFVWSLCGEYEKTAKWTLYDLQDKLKQSGWMVPAYTMPKNIDHRIVMRVVVRQGFSHDMADMLLRDIRNAVTEFEALRYPTTSRLKFEEREIQCGKVFTH
ncbi:MAG: glutamate decarboxylase [Rikenellaceae bacterium]|nr:glutamate decarboxylase [Rikenellaceae bacterium]